MNDAYSNELAFLKAQWVTNISVYRITCRISGFLIEQKYLGKLSYCFKKKYTRISKLKKNLSPSF